MAPTLSVKSHLKGPGTVLAKGSQREALTKKVDAILLRNWMRLTTSHLYGWNCKAGLVGELVDDNFWPSILLLPVGQIKASSARPG